MRSSRTLPVLAAFVLLLVSCATTATSRSPVPEPAACSDSVYAQLSHQHPDSLSERSWQRLQSLERACVAARAQTPSETGRMGMMGMAHGDGALWTGVGMLVVVAMAITMFARR